jgi:hypothetical protein
VFPPAVYSRIHNTILCTYTQTGAFITLSSSSTVHTAAPILARGRGQRDRR